jgi:flagellar biosynthesis protein FliR
MNFDITAWFLAFLRIGGLLAVIPIFSGANMPSRVRLALAAAVALLVAPNLPTPTLPHDSLWAVTGILATELGIGLLLGFIGRMIFFTVELAGSLIGTEIGLAMPSSFNPLSNSQGSPPAAILIHLTTIIWLCLDLHHSLLLALHRSYQLLPVGHASISETLVTDVIARSQGVFHLALQISAPMVAVAFLVSILFAVLARAVPQINVFFESFSVRILAGLIVLGLSCQLIAVHLVNFLSHVPEDLLQVARLLGAPA